MTDDDDESVDEEQWKMLYSISNANCVIFLISDFFFFVLVCFISIFYCCDFCMHKLHKNIKILVQHRRSFGEKIIYLTQASTYLS